jgi:hypothetical protein
MFRKPKVLLKEELSEMREIVTNKIVTCFTKNIQERIDKSLENKFIIRLGPGAYCGSCGKNDLISEIMELNFALKLNAYDIVDDAVDIVKKDLEKTGFKVENIVKPRHYIGILGLLMTISW